MNDRLFVYGTLAPGQLNEHVLADLPGRREPGTVVGRLVDEGWGAASGYPALALDAAGDPVAGSLISTDELAARWASLDEFLGEGYDRVPAEVVLRDGSRVTAHVYTVLPDSD